VNETKFDEPENHVYIHRDFFLKQRIWDMPRYQAIEEKYFVTKHNGKAVFVSHRWMTAGLPDIGGRQLMMIKDFLNHNPEVECVWYDYMCMPQKPRSSEDELIFKDRLSTLNNVIASCPKTYILHEDNYMERTWCKAELFMCGQLYHDEGQGNFVPDVIFDSFLIPCLLSLLNNDMSLAKKKISNMLATTKVTNGADKKIINEILLKYVTTPSTAILLKIETILNAKVEDISNVVSKMTQDQLDELKSFIKV
jgi:hypothetical protein